MCLSFVCGAFIFRKKRIQFQNKNSKLLDVLHTLTFLYLEKFNSHTKYPGIVHRENFIVEEKKEYKIIKLVEK
jgi:hypothetical protein